MEIRWNLYRSPSVRVIKGMGAVREGVMGIHGECRRQLHDVRETERSDIHRILGRMEALDCGSLERACECGVEV